MRKKNEEIYKTAAERDEAFKDFCLGHEECHDCPLKRTLNDCRFDWLELEASDESEAKNEK